MECLWLNSIIKFVKVLWSYLIAVARLIIWVFILFFTGLQRTLFMKSEVVGVDFKVMPLRCYREELDDKLAYLDKLCIENPDLIGMEDDQIPFDDIMLEDEDNGPDEGFEDNGEDKE